MLSWNNHYYLCMHTWYLFKVQIFHSFLQHLVYAPQHVYPSWICWAPFSIFLLPLFSSLFFFPPYLPFSVPSHSSLLLSFFLSVNPELMTYLQALGRLEDQQLCSVTPRISDITQAPEVKSCYTDGNPAAGEFGWAGGSESAHLPQEQNLQSNWDY